MISGTDEGGVEVALLGDKCHLQLSLWVQGVGVLNLCSLNLRLSPSGLSLLGQFGQGGSEETL